MRVRNLKFPALLAIVLLLVVALAGCVALEQQPSPEGGPPANAPETTAVAPTGVAPLPTEEAPVTPMTPEEARTLWQDIQEDGVMVVGVSSGYPPFSFYSPDGQLDGFDINLMRELGKRLGVEIQFQDMPFDQLLDKVQSGEVDAAIGAIAITPDRQEKVAFTSPYLKGNVSLLANADAVLPNIQSVDDLAEVKVAAEAGTDFDQWLRSQVESGLIPRENVFLYPTIEQAIDALVGGEVDVVMVDSFTADDLARQVPGKLQLTNRRNKPLLTYKPLTDTPLQGVQWVMTSYADANGDLVPSLPVHPLPLRS